MLSMVFLYVSYVRGCGPTHSRIELHNYSLLTTDELHNNNIPRICIILLITLKLIIEIEIEEKAS